MFCRLKLTSIVLNVGGNTLNGDYEKDILAKSATVIADVSNVGTRSDMVSACHIHTKLFDVILLAQLV